MIKNFTIRAVRVAEKANSKGLAPVKICVTFKGRRAVKGTGIRCIDSDWNESLSQLKGGAPNAMLINASIRKKVSETEAQILSHEYNKTSQLTIERIRSILQGKPENASLIEFAENYFHDNATKYKAGTLIAYRSALKRLSQFQDKVTFSDVDVSWLKKYEAHLREPIIKHFQNGKITSVTLSNNSVHRHWRFLKVLFNAAIREGRISEYPFRQYSKPPVYIQTDSTYLTMPEEVDKIEEVLRLPCDEQIYHMGHYFLLGCYSGLRHSDWLRFNPSFIRGERLVLRAKKNGKMVSMKIHARLRRVLDVLLTLPPCYTGDKTRHFLKMLGELAGIEKHITTHTGRHTFGTRCAELGMSIETTAELMGISVKTCSVYYRITGTKSDNDVMKWDN